MKTNDRYADAVEYFSNEASVAGKIGARYLQLIALENRAGCYLNLGELDRALQSLLEARSQLSPEIHLGTRADVTMQLAEVYSSLQRNSEALGYYREAFQIIRNDQKLDDYAPAAERLAAALIQTGNFTEAEIYNNLAFEGLRKYQLTNSTYTFDSALCELNRADIAALRKQTASAVACYRKSLSLATTPNAVRWSAFAGLAEMNRQQGHVVEARQNFESALQAIEANRLLQKSAENQITFLTALIHFYQQYVDFLVEQKQPNEALKVADSSRASVLSGLQVTRQDSAFYAKIRGEAQATNTAILFYWLGPEKSYVWAITPTGDEFLPLPKGSEIDKLVQTYSHSIQSAQQDTLARQSSAGFSLYKILIGPIASHIKPDSQVVVVPDGVLHSLNFETLLVSDGKTAPHYWIEDVRLTVAPSLRMLLEKSKPLNPSKQALVMGGAIYSGAKYSQLSGSQAEVEKISALFPKSSTVMLTGRSAVPEAFEKAQPELFSIIHISAHAIDNPRSPLDSAIILSGPEGSRELYAIDLMRKANRFNADLVTISGCNSVGTALKGEGMVGFAWAAFAAGARNAVTSLWEVDDRSTTELMDHFYLGVTQGKPYAQALRDAKLRMLKGSFKKPYYWAPFQLYSRSLTSAPNHVLQAKR
jgi:CHAT domain-containing protein